MIDESLSVCVEELSTTGITLSVEERLILGVSLLTLQRENRFPSVGFQGKIFGVNSDYYIAYGRGDDFIRNKMFFYSLDGRFWRLLFPPSPADLSEFRHVRNRFVGDPTEVHRLHVAGRKVAIREENRLSAAVHLMDWETAVGPKGALEIDPRSGWVKINPYFKGLPSRDLVDLGSFVHHRLPRSLDSFAPNRLLAEGDPALNFLEPIRNDYPPGCWLVRHDATRDAVRLHNLWWLGHAFYHRGTAWGSLYMGLGDRNDDLPFML